MGRMRRAGLVFAALLLGACFGDDRGHSTSCGDGVLDDGEGCDDGNIAGGDGCSAVCAVETATPVCGNGVRESGEACDDGNTTSGDGCSDRCAIETPGAVCGDGVQQGGEQCDDGNTASFDGCSGSCVIEPLRTLTLVQNTDATTIVAGNSRACHYTSGAMGTAENHYYRVFRLSEHAIGGAFDVDSISFAIETAESTTGATQPATIRIHRYDNATIADVLVEGDMEQLATDNITIPSSAEGTIVTYPIDAIVPAGGTVIAELSTPDHPEASPSAGTKFYIGSNSAGHSRSGYIKMPATGCNHPDPEATDSIAVYVDMHILMTVTGKAY